MASEKRFNPRQYDLERINDSLNYAYKSACKRRDDYDYLIDELIYHLEEALYTTERLLEIEADR